MPWSREDLQQALDRRFLIDTLVKLLKVPTDVPLGPQTLMEPDDPKLVHYVQHVIRPLLMEIGAHELMEAPLNQLVVRLGEGRRTGRNLLVMAYTPTQHNNFTREPFAGRIVLGTPYGLDEPVAVGQGVSQNKVHMAAMLTVLKLLVDRGVTLEGRLFFAVNNEGRSSHACSEALIPLLSPKPNQGLLLLGTGMRISVGNRGRVDIYVHVRGRAAHSSQPEQGLSAIDGVQEVLSRIGRVKLDGPVMDGSRGAAPGGGEAAPGGRDSVHDVGLHPLLGARHLVPYQITYWPLAPHTLPESAKITLDRRLLPGDDIDAAVDDVRRAIGDLSPYEVKVVRGVHMLPALVDPSRDIVRWLQASNMAVRGQECELQYGQGSFDAGGPCALGIPTVMWGASGGAGLLGDDYVALSAAWDEAAVLAHLMLTYLG